MVNESDFEILLTKAINAYFKKLSKEEKDLCDILNKDEKIKKLSPKLK